MFTDFSKLTAYDRIDVIHRDKVKFLQLKS